MSNILRLTYDTEHAPLSFDFVFCLAICRAICEQHNLNSTFDVQLVNRGYRSVGIEAKYDAEHQRRKFHEVIINTAMICRWVNSISIIRTETPTANYAALDIPLPEMSAQRGKIPEWQITPMVPKQLSKIIDNGGRISQPGFTASSDTLKRYDFISGDCVVLHPRCSIYDAGRNSDFQLFLEVAEGLRTNGYRVFLVPDIEDLRNRNLWKLFPAEILVECSYSYEARLAAAELATCNLLWTSGINTPLLFSDCRLLCVGALNEKSTLSHQDIFHRKGPTPGLQPNWLDESRKLFDWTPAEMLTSKHVIENLMRVTSSSPNHASKKNKNHE